MWAWTIGTELCCFAAGQLSWTISVLTGLWSQVVLSVYHEDIILWLSSSVPQLHLLGGVSHEPFLWGALSNCSLFRAGRRFRREALGPADWLLFVLLACSLSARLVWCCPLSNCQRPALVYSSDKNEKNYLPAVGLCVSIDKLYVFDALWGDWFQQHAEGSQSIFSVTLCRLLDCSFSSAYHRGHKCLSARASPSLHNMQTLDGVPELAFWYGQRSPVEIRLQFFHSSSLFWKLISTIVQILK